MNWLYPWIQNDGDSSYSLVLKHRYPRHTTRPRPEIESRARDHDGMEFTSAHARAQYR